MLNKKMSVYLILTFTFTWLLWLPFLLRVQFGYSIVTFPGQFFFGSFGPFVGALLTTLWFDGVTGVLNWFKRTYSLRVNKKMWFVAFGLPILYFIVAVSTQKIALGHWPDWSTFGHTEKLPGFSLIFTLMVWVLTFGLGEESGWRGFLLVEMHKKTSLLNSALGVALIWMIWHFPAFFFNPTYLEMGWGIIGWAIGLSYGSILLAWMTRESRWSIIPVVIWHGGFDLLTASDQSAEIMAMVISLLVIIHGIYLSRKLAKEVHIKKNGG